MKVKTQNMILPIIPNLHKSTRSGNASVKASTLSYMGSQEDQTEHFGNDVIHVEDYDATVDEQFVKDQLQPYLRTLYKDLLNRYADQDGHIAKVTFVDYTRLPGIINDRLFAMF